MDYKIGDYIVVTEEYPFEDAWGVVTQITAVYPEAVRFKYTTNSYNGWETLSVEEMRPATETEILTGKLMGVI